MRATATAAWSPRERTSQPFALGNAALLADVSGAVFWPAESTLLVADLHLEKGAAHAARGDLLPPYDTCETLSRLAKAMARYRPARVIALGDSFHVAAARLEPADISRLQTLQSGCDWIWLTGNHDPHVPPGVGGQVLPDMEIGGITLRHEPVPGFSAIEIAGHLHPAARVSVDGYSARRRCFVGNGQRLVMPAFGAFTGGLNVLDPAFVALFGPQPADLSVWMLGNGGLFGVATRHLRGD